MNVMVRKNAPYYLQIMKGSDDIARSYPNRSLMGRQYRYPFSNGKFKFGEIWQGYLFVWKHRKNFLNFLGGGQGGGGKKKGGEKKNFLVFKATLGV